MFKNRFTYLLIFFILLFLIYLLCFRYDSLAKDSIIDQPNFRCFDEIKNKWREIADEAQIILNDAPVLNIDRDYSQWEEIDEEFIQELNNNYGWIKAWKVNKEGGNDKWLNYGLFYKGFWFDENIKRCPKIYKFLKRIENKINIAGLSLMRPKSKIDKHVDVNGQDKNLAFHLGLIVPEPKGSCYLGVDDKKLFESDGKVIIFDATHEHYAVNNSDSDRVILYLDLKN